MLMNLLVHGSSDIFMLLSLNILVGDASGYAFVDRGVMVTSLAP